MSISSNCESVRCNARENSSEPFRPRGLSRVIQKPSLLRIVTDVCHICSEIPRPFTSNIRTAVRILPTIFASKIQGHQYFGLTFARQGPKVEGWVRRNLDATSFSWELQAIKQVTVVRSCQYWLFSEEPKLDQEKILAPEAGESEPVARCQKDVGIDQRRAMP